MVTCLFLQGFVLRLKELPPGFYAEVWTSFGLFGYEVAGRSWLGDLVPSLLILHEVVETADLILLAEENLPFGALNPVGYAVEKLLSFLYRVSIIVVIVFAARVLHLFLSLPDYGLVVLYGFNLVLALHIVLYRALSSRDLQRY
ncbi:hypothetical protein P171DRAFT_489512 [Karstenula rhodostoma CBS 690.94]|uniref:Uncharacterized protein n=1 Tax=Karstenula rhodostoma CBS 690.94 TaxID=1392251 RepID=A0A9P4U717_9PLEO|nr:hypothetical protein P171DRAFT_489512 [Karstenula rhodostoma CBS 690.94]